MSVIDVDDGASTETQPDQEVTLDSVVTPVEEPGKAQPETEQPESNIPEKYQGKSINDVIEMHQNAEKQIGRSSNEIGELRKVVDDFITTQSQSTPEQPQEEEADFFADPNKAVEQAIAKNPAVQEAQKAAKTLKAQEAAAKAEAALLAEHPDANEILGSKEFQERLSKSPLMQETIARAAREQDAGAMAKVFDEWKANLATPQVDTASIGSQQEQVKQASTGAVKAGAGESRKLYRRTDIINLMVDDPDRYQQLLPEIEQAYRDKRVIT